MASRQGISFVEIIVALGILGGISLVIAQLGTSTGNVQQRAYLATASNFAVLEATIAQNSLPNWLANVRAGNNIIKQCLPTDPSVTPNCPPASTITDSEIASLTAGESVTSVNLLGSGGMPLGGTENAPVYFTNQGVTCLAGANNPLCALKSVAYMARENSSLSDPGSVRFLIKVSANNSSGTANLAVKSIISEIYVGQNWKPFGTCDSSAPDFNGFDANRKPYCTVASDVPSGAVLFFNSNCPAGYTELLTMRDRYARANSIACPVGDTDGASSRNIQLAANQIPSFTRTISGVNLFQYQDKGMLAVHWGSQNDPKTIYGRSIATTTYQFPQLPINQTFGSPSPRPIAVQTLPPFVAMRACRKN